MMTALFKQLRLGMKITGLQYTARDAILEARTITATHGPASHAWLLAHDRSYQAAFKRYSAAMNELEDIDHAHPGRIDPHPPGWDWPPDKVFRVLAGTSDRVRP